MKSLPIIAIIIAVIIALNELAYLEQTSLAWVIIGICVAIGLLAFNQLQNQKKD